MKATSDKPVIYDHEIKVTLELTLTELRHLQRIVAFSPYDKNAPGGQNRAGSEFITLPFTLKDEDADRA